MDDSTRILESGTQDYPLDAGIASGVENCPHCTTSIAAGMMFCPSCGYQRGTWAAAAGAQSGTGGQTATPAERGPALFELQDESGASHALPEGVSVLGRGEVEISIADGYLSRRHASFSASPGRLVITDLGSANGSFIGDLRLERDVEHELQDGQTLRLGNTVFSVRSMDFEPAAEASETLISSVQSDYSDVGSTETESIEPVAADTSEAAQAGRELSGWCIANDTIGSLAIPLGETTLGRSASRSDLQISGDGYVSGLHGLLVASDEGLSFSDLGSTNGSMINGEPVAANDEVSLMNGDRLQLGQTQFLVSYSGPEGEVEGNPDEPGVMA
ncbi:FHA domain-containing protein [bacterium]|nr:FHA domain-containing protein [bacterium]